MSNTIFDFMLVDRFRYLPMHDTVSVRGNEGVAISRPDAGSYGIYRAEMTVYVPGNGYLDGTAQTIDSWLAFLRTIQGPFDTFLFREPLVEFMYAVANTDADGAIGTGDGAETDFALNHVHIRASTLQVWKAGVLQTLTTHYTLEDNNTAPIVRFVLPPSGGQAITVAYEFYYPVRFITDPDPGDWAGALEDFTSRIQIEEDYAGAHRV